MFYVVLGIDRCTGPVSLNITSSGVLVIINPTAFGGDCKGVGEGAPLVGPISKTDVGSPSISSATT